MCLDISKDSTKLKRAVRKKKEKIIAYKILKSENKTLISSYLGTRWFTNKEMVSDRKGKDPTRITKKESEYQEIYYGLHFYANLATALYFYYRPPYKIYMVEIDPKDIVAFGYNDQLVAHKAKIIKRVN